MILSIVFWVFLGLADLITAQPTNQTSCKINVNPNIDDIRVTSYANLVRSVQLSTGHTYRYVFKAPFNSSMSTILFLHGWPETSYSWVHQIEYFTRQGYGVVAPDMLGTGGSDNPDDLESFSLKRTSAEMNELLDCEGLGQVVGVGHDIGSGQISRIQHYHPDRLSALALLSLGYAPPGQDFTSAWVDANDEFTLATYGYPLLAYWHFNNRDDAGPIADQHLDAVYNIAYGTDSTLRLNISEPGALERWLLADGRSPFQNDFVNDVTLAQWRTIALAQGGMTGSFKWYKAMLRGYNTADEEALKNSTDPMVTKPSLIIVGDKDPLSIPSVQLSTTTPYFPFLTVRTAPAKHFIMAETPTIVNQYLHDFLRSLEN